MTETAERYDRIAAGYDRWWAPVLAPSAVALLDRLDGVVSGGARAVLDVGVGTGNLSIAALRRWPDIQITAIDASREMIGAVEALVAERVPASRDRFEGRVAFAAELPFEDRTFDAAMSSFVLQLVPSRAAALREVRRVLEPGGTFAWVSWLRAERAFEPDRVANAVLDDFGFDPPEPDLRTGDPASREAAALGMRRAGFREVRAWPGEVVHAWDAEGYLDFLTQFDEASLFADLESGERRDIEAAILDRLRALGSEQLTLRLPVVYVVGKAPA